MKRFASVLFFMLLFIFVMISCNTQTDKPKASTASSVTAADSTIVPTSSGTTSQAAAGIMNDVVTQYYQAIEKQNYGLAYTYLDPVTTKLSQTAFIQEAQAQDKEEGKMQSYSVAVFPPTIVMTNMRAHLGPYHVHLQLKLEGSSWKIISLDRI